MTTRGLFHLASILLLSFVTAASAVDVKVLPIGSAAPDFSLPGVDGKTYSLKSFADAKLLCVIFTCNHCPTAQAYEDRIIQLYKDYTPKGVAIIAVNPNSPGGITLNELRYTDLSDSFDEMKVRAKERNFEFPYLYDGEKQEMAHAYGCLATPHVFLFDSSRKLRYQGAIDDQQVKPVTHHYLHDAIESLLASKPVETETTRVFGCSTKWIVKSDLVKKATDKWNAEPVAISEIDAKAVAALVANDSPNLRLINLWATWCAPCVAEMPELVDVHRTYRSRKFEVITISIDDVAKKEKALAFMTKVHMSATNYLYNSDNKDALAAALDKQWEGPVPYTLLVAPGGKILYRVRGQIDPLELRKKIVDILGRTYAGEPGR